jgi:Uri superfamily endonuclease
MFSSLRALPMKGIYTLIMFLPKETRLSIGRLGVCRFPRGYYVYTGSALGMGSSGLRGRISRHLRKKKRKFWHIDFLLAHKNMILKGVVAARTSIKLECEMNRYIKEIEKAEIPVSGFGASDCRKNCGSHLLHFKKDVKLKIAELYAEKLGLKPTIIILPLRRKSLKSPLFVLDEMKELIGGSYVDNHKAGYR